MTDPMNPGTGESGANSTDNQTEFNTPMPTEPSPVVPEGEEPQPEDDDYGRADEDNEAK